MYIYIYIYIGGRGCPQPGNRSVLCHACVCARGLVVSCECVSNLIPASFLFPLAPGGFSLSLWDDSEF